MPPFLKKLVKVTRKRWPPTMAVWMPSFWTAIAEFLDPPVKNTYMFSVEALKAIHTSMECQNIFSSSLSNFVN